MGISIFAWVAYYLWIFSEFFIVIKTKRQRKGISAEQKDKGSFWFMVIAIFLSVFLVFLCQGMGWGNVNRTVSDIGATLAIIGVLFRLWSVIVLGKHFSLKVSVTSEQKIIQHGPYRLLRHPSYTGALITFIGIGLALNTWIGAFILLLAFVIVYTYRIRIEEKLLNESFPEQYPDYAKRTWRLVPFIW